MIVLPESISKLAYKFKDNGYELYLVGGAVRDILLTSALADPSINTKEKLLNSFKEHNFKQLHKKYGIKYEKGKKK